MENVPAVSTCASHDASYDNHMTVTLTGSKYVHDERVHPLTE